jgi:hypothetical protein
LENKKLGDKVVYHTDPDGITREVWYEMEI